MRVLGSRRRRWLVAGALAALGLGATDLAAFELVSSGSAGRIVSPEDAPSAPVAIVPGAGVRPDGTLSLVLEDRLVVARDLHRARKVRKLLVSGDHGSLRYDEPNAMASELEREGIPPSDIFLDHAGFDTYATLYRARHVFGVTDALIVSQEFHLPRAIYMARALGIDATGVRADRRDYDLHAYYAFRESAARVKAIVATELGLKPRFLGSPIPIEGDGAVTRDRIVSR